MPNAPQKPCPQPRCPHLQPCPVHVRAAWRGTTPAPPRIRGGRLQRLRAQLFTEQPLCVLCQAEGRVTIATIRDHKIPLAEGGRDEPSNTQPICADCHRRKTEAERNRGTQRVIR
jgi:5-methylcytosine-specific restriction protein A